MAILEIPMRNDLASFQMRLTLDEEVFEFSFRYNLRMKRWIMDITDSEETPILVGVPLLTNVDLHKRYKVETLPKGTLLVFEDQGRDINPEREDLGDTHSLLYQELT